MNRHLRVLVLIAALLASAVPASAANLAGQWRFDEGQGQIVGDSSGHGVTGVLGTTKAVDARDPTWRESLFGTALHFDGSDQVTLADDPRLEPPTVSVTAWVRRDGTPGQWRYIVSKGGSACFASSYGLYTGFGQGLAFYILDPQDGYIRSPEAGTELWDGRWHHVAGTYDGLRVRAYVDGAEIGSGTPTSAAIRYGIQSRGAFIGAYRGSCELDFVNGDIDEVEIWDGALSATEIADAAARRPSVIPPGQPVAPPAPTRPPTTVPPAARACPTISLSRSSLRPSRRTRLAITPRGLAGRTIVRLAGAGIDRVVRVREGHATWLWITPRRPGVIRVQALDAPRPIIRYGPKRIAAGRLVKVSVWAARLGLLPSVRVRISAPGITRVVRVYRNQIARVEIRTRRSGPIRVAALQSCGISVLSVR